MNLSCIKNLVILMVVHFNKKEGKNMAQTIQIKRGLKANLPLLLIGETAFCTDTKEIYVGEGTYNALVGRVMMGTDAARPNAGVAGRLYYVTSGTNTGYLYLDTSSAWVKVNVTSLDEVTDGSTYGKVKKSELNNGTVKQLNDGTNVVTASEAKTHINDVNKHRVINDTATLPTALWSSSKINSEIYNAIRGLEWQDSVKSRNTTTPPTTNTNRDRYIVPASATGAWSGKTNQIAHWNGSAWEFYAPEVGWSVYVDDENKNYVYNGTNWVKSGEANQSVVAGAGLTGGGSSDNITLNVGAGDGITVATDAVAVKAGAGINVDSNGVGVKAGNGVSVDANGVGVKLGWGLEFNTDYGVSAKCKGPIILSNGAIALNYNEGLGLVNGELSVTKVDGGTF